MNIKVTELCLVDYINEEDIEKDDNKEVVATRTVIYESKKNTLLEAFKDYDESFNIDNVIESYDNFEGECLDFVKYVSVIEIDQLK